MDTTAPAAAPRLSVVVTVVDGGAALERCLDALASQEGVDDIEVLVPYDATLEGAAAWAARWPAFRFLDAGRLPTTARWDSAAGQHELFDRRRAHGLARATGDVVAIVEDRGAPRRDWARAMLAAHEVPAAVVGGPVANARDRLVNWGVYFCDFSRYSPPLAGGPAEWVTDVNIAYKRRALEATEELWRERYHETTVHWALQRAGEVLHLDPRPVVEQDRGELGLGRAASERFAWGRLFAYTRAREIAFGKRLVLAALTPLLPFVLLVRHARTNAAPGRRLGRYVVASPVVFLLCALWAAGECAGYLTGRA